ncbi:MAG: hypothetical protein HXL09_02635 [Candidatus Nanosynbacter sp.]|nr:hypothetical protein [Candidatus Nanosynbacter sp.]
MSKKTLLINRISNLRSLKTAWLEIKKNPNSYGSDGVTIQNFEDNLDKHLKTIQTRLKAGNYHFDRLRLYLIRKSNGEFREIKISSVQDRIVQRSIFNATAQNVNRMYKIRNSVSFAFIPNGGVEKAIKAVQKYRRNNYRYCCKTDITHFFNNINKQALLEQVLKSLPDHSIDGLIRDIIFNDIGASSKTDYKNKVKKEYIFDNINGIAQGDVLSPLFSNIYLSGFDAFMELKKYKMVRYADDIIILTADKNRAKQAFIDANNFLSGIGLKLYKLGNSKTKEKHSVIGPLQNKTFLGITFRSDKVYIADESYANIKRSIKEVIKQNRNNQITFFEAVTKISEKISGWCSAYSFVSTERNKLINLDEALEKNIDELLRNNNLKKTSKKISVINTLGVQCFSEKLGGTTK